MNGFFSSISNIFDIVGTTCWESRRKGSQALVAIVFSCVGLEAFINLLAEIGRKNEFKDSPKELLALQALLYELESSRESLATKYSVVPIVLHSEPFDKGSLPYQDFDCLLSIRNALVHSRPDRFQAIEDGSGFSKQQPNFINHLASRKIITKPKDTCLESWAGLISHKQVAVWAQQTACDMIKEVLSFMPACKTKLFLESMAPSTERTKKKMAKTANTHWRVL